MRIYLIRHGETDYNIRQCYYGRTEAMLTEEGVRQAEAFGEYFRDIHWDHVVVSPLKRAWDTAMLAAGSRREVFISEDRLMEQDFGIFEGRTYKEICKEYPAEMAAWNADFAHLPDPRRGELLPGQGESGGMGRNH